MTISTRASRHAHIPTIWFTTAVGLASAALVVGYAQSAQAAAVSVPLGTAESFSVLAGSGITNTGLTTLAGDMGTFPTTSVAGPTAPVVLGTDHGGDAITKNAKPDLDIAYNAAASQGPINSISADLGGSTLESGVYNSASSMGLTGALTLDGKGDAGSVWVFQTGTTLTTASASSIVLINGAQACNVFWQIGSSATLGTSSSFVGTLMAMESITLTTGATVQGRMLARSGAVTMDTNTITKATCASGSGDDDDGDDDGTIGGPGDGTGSGDGTGNGSGTGTDGGGDGSATDGTGDTAADQISDVPVGSVDTGDGQATDHRLPAGILIALSAGCAGVAVFLRRRTS